VIEKRPDAANHGGEEQSEKGKLLELTKLVRKAPQVSGQKKTKKTEKGGPCPGQRVMKRFLEKGAGSLLGKI